jgi:hypothetical protein
VAFKSPCIPKDVFRACYLERGAGLPPWSGGGVSDDRHGEEEWLTECDVQVYDIALLYNAGQPRHSRAALRLTQRPLIGDTLQHTISNSQYAPHKGTYMTNNLIHRPDSTVSPVPRFQTEQTLTCIRSLGNSGSSTARGNCPVRYTPRGRWRRVRRW